MFRVVLLTLIFLALPRTAKAERDVSIHVLTMGPDKYLITRFGHIALLVEDEKTGDGKVYNFGEFDYRDPDLALNLVTGRVNYFLDVFSFQKMLAFYRRVGRGLTSRKLNLTAAEKQGLLLELERNARPQNRYYKYRHLTNNCCTRVRDLVDDAIGGALSRASLRAQRTYRYWLVRSLKPMPLARLSLEFLLGPEADRPISKWEEQFFPEVLSASLDQVRLPPDNRPLVFKKRVLSKPLASRIVPFGRLLKTLAISGCAGLLLLCFVAAIVFPHRRYSMRLLGAGLTIWGFVAGIGGGLLLFLWSMTDHTPAYCNENLLVFPVSHLWLVIAGVFLLRRAILTERMRLWLWRYFLLSLGVIFLNIVLKIGPFYQVNGTFIATALVMNTVALIAVNTRGKTRAT